jgi:hypothetical protein
VEAFAALEVTAVIVANARITESLGLPEELSSYIINSYLYPLFTVMLLIFIFSRQIKLTFNPFRFFVFGLAVFAGGNIVCSQAQSLSRFCGAGHHGGRRCYRLCRPALDAQCFSPLRIVRPLVWVRRELPSAWLPADCGSAFRQFSPEGWRDFFLLNAGLGVVTALFAALGLWRRQWAYEDHTPVAVPEQRGKFVLRS